MKQQLSIFSQLNDSSGQALKKGSLKVHGGVQNKGRRKSMRPLDRKKWIHLILKSDRAKKDLSFLNIKNRVFVDSLVKAKAKKFGIKIARYQNMGNHLHFKIKIQNREQFQHFLRSITTLIARKITGAKKGQKFGRFWQGLAFTRVISSRIEELGLDKYLTANKIERDQGYNAREMYLTQINQWMAQLRNRQRVLNSA